MKKIEGAKMASSILLGDGHPKFCFRLKSGLTDMGSCAATSEVSRSACLPERFVILNLRD